MAEDESRSGKRFSINEFTGGLDQDTNYLKLEPNAMVDARNIRLITEDGQGYVATNLKGNEKKFELSNGFVPLGHCEYNGIVFIFSTNPNNNLGELGCYPSPCQFTEGCSEVGTGNPDGCDSTSVPIHGFNDVYSPLQTWVAGINPKEADFDDRRNLTTSKFAFDCTHQIECFSRINYDKSVNIYFTDFLNPIRKLNNGFDIFTGECLPHFYGEESFPNGVALFANTATRPKVTLSNLESTGQLLAGNWIFFFRYATESFNTTDWIANSGPVQVSPDDALLVGLATDGASGLTVTNRSVRFELTNVDDSYKYFECGFIYYHDGTWDTGLIDKFYIISPGTQTTIKITGNEVRLPIDISDLFVTKQQYDVAKSITQFENRLFAGNLKTTLLFDDSLVEFAKLIEPKYDDSLVKKDTVFADGGVVDSGPDSVGEYKDPFLTYNNVGYFRGETYAFAVVFVFRDGKESQAFPVRGVDDWDGSATYSGTIGGVYNENEVGAYRFPNAIRSQPYTTGFVRIMGVRFNTANAEVFGDTCDFINNNVEGYYITRAKRKPNIEFQGIGLKCIKPNPTGLEMCSYSDNKVNNSGTGSTPTWQKYPEIPFFGEADCGIGDKPEWVLGAVPYLAKPDKKRFGIYSIDHFILDNFSGGNKHLMPIGEAIINETASTEYPEPVLKPYLYEEIDINYESQVQVVLHQTYDIPGWVDTTVFGFRSLWGEGADPIGTGWWYVSSSTGVKWSYMSQKNLSFATTVFCGVDKENLNLNRKIINVYKANPEPGQYDIALLYSSSSEDYYKIGDFIERKSFHGIFYQGDCFLQRYYMKQLFNGAGYNPDDTEEGLHKCKTCVGDDKQGLYSNVGLYLTVRRKYGFGALHSVVTENAVNSAMRMVEGPLGYYPEVNIQNKEEFAINDINKESNALNLGYNETLTLKSHQGYDPDIPYVNKEFPTRIIFSMPHDPNSFADNYGTVGPASFKDFDYRLGQINKIVDFNTKLMSVQERGINYHLVNERQLLETPNSSALLLGDGTTLDAKAHALTDMLGTQHQWSITKTDNAIYGVDFNKRKIWRILAGQEGGLETISDSSKIRKWITETVDQYGNISDVTSTFKDNPICQEGVVSAYDRKNNEVIFTFLFNPEGKQGGFKCEPEDIIANSRTIVWNEWIAKFVSERSFHSPYYLSISEDFYSLNPLLSSPIVSPPGVPLSEFYLHDVGDYSVFYGIQENFFIKFVVNDVSDATKVFDNLQISSNGEPFESIEYRTQDQLSSHSPFQLPSEPYRNPRYRENLWKFPISRADTVLNTTNNIYQVKSRLRGRWLEIQIIGNTTNHQFIKSVLTAIRGSKN